MSQPSETAPGDVTWRSEPRPWGWSDLLAISVWTAAVVAFFWKAVSLSEAFFYFDITEINFPYRDFLAQEMRLGRFSRWFPGLYCGQPLYSESQAGYWHPLKFVLYPWLATWKAFNLDTVLSVWLTGLGTYGWLRRHVSATGALTGAAIFGFSGFVWAHLIHTSMTNALVSVPLVIWGLESTWDGGRWRGAVLGALALACQVFAGHLQDTLLTGALVGVYAWYRLATEPRLRDGFKALGVACLMVGLGVALAAVQWIPSKELLDRSPRAAGLTWPQLTYGSWHPELLPTLVIREAYGTRARDTDWMDGFYPYHEMNAYVGLIALALAVVGGAAARDRWVGFWVIVAWLALMLMLGRYTFLFDYLHRVPILGSSRIPVRFHLWMSLAIAALAAVGVDRLTRPGAIRLRPALLLTLGLVVASIPILYMIYEPVWSEPRRWTSNYHVNRFQWLSRELMIAGLRTAVLCLLALISLLWIQRTDNERTRRRLAAFLPLLIMVDLLGSHLYDAPTIASTYWTEEPASVRFLKSEPRLGRVFGVAERSAGEPGYASESVDFSASRDSLGWSLAPVWGLRSSTGETPILPRRMVRYTDTAMYKAGRFDIEGVTHVLAGGQPIKTVDKNPVRVGTTNIHRNPTALPRVRIVGRPIYAVDEDDAVRRVAPSGAELLTRLIVEDRDRPMAADAEAIGTAAIVTEEPEHVVIEADCQTPGYLFLADCYDPGWWATVDGEPAPIRPADVTFRAVFLKPGKHRVEFFYRPAGFRAGLLVTLLASLVGLALWVGLVSAPRLADAHRTLGWPRRWPLILLSVCLLVILLSSIKVGSGTVAFNDRWKDSFHKFTWGAGIEAINLVRPSIGR